MPHIDVYHIISSAYAFSSAFVVCFIPRIAYVDCFTSASVSTISAADAMNLQSAHTTEIVNFRRHGLPGREKH